MNSSPLQGKSKSSFRAGTVIATAGAFSALTIGSGLWLEKRSTAEKGISVTHEKPAPSDPPLVTKGDLKNLDRRVDEIVSIAYKGLKGHSASSDISETLESSPYKIVKSRSSLPSRIIEVLETDLPKERLGHAIEHLLVDVSSLITAESAPLDRVTVLSRAATAAHAIAASSSGGVSEEDGAVYQQLLLAEFRLRVREANENFNSVGIGLAGRVHDLKLEGDSFNQKLTELAERISKRTMKSVRESAYDVDLQADVREFLSELLKLPPRERSILDERLNAGADLRGYSVIHSCSERMSQWEGASRYFDQKIQATLLHKR